MGIAETIPGVSGSTVALLVGVYDDFLDIIYRASHFVKDTLLFIVRKRSFTEVKKSFFEIPFKVAIPLFLGMVIAVLIFSKIVIYMLDNYPSYSYAFLMGLVIPCLVIVSRQIERKGVREFAIALLTFIIFFLIFGVKGSDVTDPNPIFLFIAGVVSISAMVLPGISGSFVLLILGLYHYIIGLVGRITDFDLSTSEWFNLFLFGIGVLIGVLSMAQALKYMLNKHKDILLAFLFGLILASLRVLLPFVETEIVDDEVEVIKVGIDQFSATHIAVLFLITAITSFVIITLESKSKAVTKLQ